MNYFNRTYTSPNTILIDRGVGKGFIETLLNLQAMSDILMCKYWSRRSITLPLFIVKNGVLRVGLGNAMPTIN